MPKARPRLQEASVRRNHWSPRSQLCPCQKRKEMKQKLTLVPDLRNVEMKGRTQLGARGHKEALAGGVTTSRR